jgi:transposase InsO family protein
VHGRGCGLREPLDRLIHHSDRLNPPSTSRSATPNGRAGIEPLLGSRGDSYDNALAETIIDLYKAEVILKRGPWPSLEDMELATLEWVWCFNQHRLLSPIGHVPTVEYEGRLTSCVEAADVEHEERRFGPTFRDQGASPSAFAGTVK